MGVVIINRNVFPSCSRLLPWPHYMETKKPEEWVYWRKAALLLVHICPSLAIRPEQYVPPTIVSYWLAILFSTCLRHSYAGKFPRATLAPVFDSRFRYNGNEDDYKNLPKRSELPTILGAPAGAAWFWGKDDGVYTPSTAMMIL